VSFWFAAAASSLAFSIPLPEMSGLTTEAPKRANEIESCPK